MPTSKTSAKRYDIIHSLDKGLYLLEVIEEAGHPVSLQYLWQRLKWDKATIYRLLTTLEKRAYIHRDPETREYSLGIKIYALYDSLIRQLDLQQISKPYVVRLAQETGHTAHLAVAVGNRIVFIDRVVGSGILSVNTQIGAMEPAYCTALGKAYLAYIDSNDLPDLLEEPLTRYTPNTLVDLGDIACDLAKVRRRGFAIDDEEYSSGIRCIAAAILNQVHAPVAMIGVSGPKNRINLRAMRECGELVRDASREISRKFGYGIGLDDQQRGATAAAPR
ncbi:MAG: IclR family transcriptional regulator [Spirochaetaceae bacterium]|nr:MAG: IclR family transcriptional regulator [Spirochaetaceae bacterium]